MHVAAQQYTNTHMTISKCPQGWVYRSCNLLWIYTPTCTCEFSMFRKVDSAAASFSRSHRYYVSACTVCVSIATLWVYHCAGIILPTTGQREVASEGGRVTSEVGWVNPHSECWGCPVNELLIKHILIREDEFSIHSPAGCGNSVPGLSIHPLHHIRVVADEVNSAVVTGSGVVGGEEHSLGSTWRDNNKPVRSRHELQNVCWEDCMTSIQVGNRAREGNTYWSAHSCMMCMCTCVCLHVHVYTHVCVCIYMNVWVHRMCMCGECRQIGMYVYWPHHQITHTNPHTHALFTVH